MQWVSKLNVGIECLNWMFTLNVRHAYLHWMSELNVWIECKCDLYIWILKGKVSIKDVKFKSNTRLFEDNIQMLHEGFEDYHQIFNLIDWLFVCLERIIKCLNHKLKVNSKYCTAQVNVCMFELTLINWILAVLERHVCLCKDPLHRKAYSESVRRRSSWVDFRLRNPSSPDVVFVMKALFSILDPQNRVETNTCFVFAHDFVLASRYLHFFPLLTYITDSKKFLRCLLFTDGRLQLQHSDTSTKLYRACPEIWYVRGLLSCLLGHQSTQSRKNLSCNPSVPRQQSNMQITVFSVFADQKEWAVILVIGKE